jgi:hypothetical protein
MWRHRTELVEVFAFAGSTMTLGPFGIDAHLNNITTTSDSILNDAFALLVVSGPENCLHP